MSPAFLITSRAPLILREETNNAPILSGNASLGNNPANSTDNCDITSKWKDGISIFIYQKNKPNVKKKKALGSDLECGRARSRV
jgi:hypothetical protein